MITKTKGGGLLVYCSLPQSPTTISMGSIQSNYENKLTSKIQVTTTRSLLDLATEVLIEILAYLAPADMIAMQRTCRTIRDIVAGTAYLQYTLRAKMNRVDDLLPPDFPYSERLGLLRCHERSWRDLQFNLFAECRRLSGVAQPPFFVLQDGYLIYHCLPEQGRGWQYGYTDLCQCSADRNKELRWVHLTIGGIRHLGPTMIEFAVDHNLVVFGRFCILLDLFSE